MTTVSAESTTDVEAAAVRLLAHRDHSRAELGRKLAAKGHDTGLVDKALCDLEARGLLNDERFSREYVAMRCRRGFGPVRIRAELRERGVSGDLVDRCVEDGDPNWTTLLRQTAESRFGSKPPGDQQEMGRRVRFLLQRGYPQRLIRELLLDSFESD